MHASDIHHAVVLLPLNRQLYHPHPTKCRVKQIGRKHFKEAEIMALIRTAHSKSLMKDKEEGCRPYHFSDKLVFPPGKKGEGAI